MRTVSYIELRRRLALALWRVHGVRMEWRNRRMIFAVYNEFGEFKRAFERYSDAVEYANSIGGTVRRLK